MEGILTTVSIYPIKSCRGVNLESARVTALGLERDRLWQVVDDDGEAVTQRQHKILAMVQPELLAGGLRLSAPGKTDIELADPGPTDTIVKSIFGVPVNAADGGDEIAAWFSDLLGQPYRVVGIGPNAGWRLPEKMDIFGQPAAFVDAAPILVTATSSLAWLLERASQLFEMERFRPNLVVDNDTPWLEDTWAEFRIGDSELKLGVPWPRCSIPQIDQSTAERHKEPAKVLRQYRWCVSAPTVQEGMRPVVEGNGLFGIGCTIGPKESKISVGDEVEVTSRTDPVLAMSV